VLQYIALYIVCYRMLIITAHKFRAPQNHGLLLRHLPQVLSAEEAADRARVRRWMTTWL